MSITANITQSSKIHVSWTPPVGGAVGYVIMYRKHSAKNYTTQMVEATSFVLSNLSEGVLYDIGVFAFKDLPSQLSDTLYIRLAGKLNYITWFRIFAIHFACNVIQLSL